MAQCDTRPAPSNVQAQGGSNDGWPNGAELMSANESWPLNGVLPVLVMVIV